MFTSQSKGTTAVNYRQGLIISAEMPVKKIHTDPEFFQCVQNGPCQSGLRLCHSKSRTNMFSLSRPGSVGKPTVSPFGILPLSSSTNMSYITVTNNPH